MKRIVFLLALTLLTSCSAHVVQKTTETEIQNCLGNTEIPAKLEDSFEVVEDKNLLNSALGKLNEGKLCWGQVYQSKENSEVTVFRAWNSTNPNSRMGNWWAFQKPNGKVSLYRFEYEICYQWSPLDRLDVCRLKPGVKIVVGTGQSAKCSEYLTYPTSKQKQIYIKDASESVIDCTEYDLIFNWQ